MFDFELEFEEEAKRIERIKSEEVVTAIRDATPVDTGRARDGWSLKDNKIENDVPYVEHLNNGTATSDTHKHFIESAIGSVKGVKLKGVI